MDKKDFKNEAMRLLGNVKKQAKKYAPTEFSDDKKFIRACAGTLSLMLIADRVIEDQEVEDGIDFLKSLGVVQELGLEKEAVEYFKEHVNKLKVAVEKGNDDYIFAVEEIVMQVGDIKGLSDYREILLNLLQFLEDQSSFNPSEAKMKQKLIQALEPKPA